MKICGYHLSAMRYSMFVVALTKLLNPSLHNYIKYLGGVFY